MNLARKTFFFYIFFIDLCWTLVRCLTMWLLILNVLCLFRGWYLFLSTPLVFNYDILNWLLIFFCGRIMENYGEIIDNNIDIAGYCYRRCMMLLIIAFSGSAIMDIAHYASWLILQTSHMEHRYCQKHWLKIHCL